MRVPVDVICNVCDSVFCCADCRYRHELKNHSIAVQQKIKMPEHEAGMCGDKTSTIFLFCALCAKKPLELRADMFEEMLEHVRDNHLPLHCVKCDKVYQKVEDLREFSKCLHASMPCNEAPGDGECSSSSTEQTSCATDASKVTVTKDMQRTTSTTTTMSTQTSPMRHDFNETHLTTPIAVINSRWKAKCKNSHEEFISDSVSSIRNLSSISNSSIRRSIEALPKGKGTLVRSTSTPVHAEVFYGKPKEQTFNATGGGQVSSIYTSHCEAADNSPAVPNGRSPKPMENMNRCYFKVGGRVKMSAVTPLRHVMSKSIQKAFAEHGALPQSASVRPHGHVLHGKKMFDSNDSSGHMGNGLEAASPTPPPLDLRLSPAVRRTQNRQSFTLQDTHSMNAPHKNVIQPDILMSTESIVITRTRRFTSNASNATNQSASSSTSSASSVSASANNGSSVYKTCQSVEIITSTTAELSEVNIQTEPNNNVKQNVGFMAVNAVVVPHLTPITRIQGAVLNKKLQFDTPQVNAENPSKSPHNDEVFFTPDSTPVRKSTMRRQSTDTSPTSGNSKKTPMPRKLSSRFSPSRRPPLRNCSEHAAFSHVEDVSDDYDDEVFLPKVASTKQRTEPQEKEKKTKSDTTETTVVKDSARTWSLSSFMSSVMRLPVLKGKGNDKVAADVVDNSNSILRRCSSIAGSMIRPQSISEKEKPLKRKRTQTMDNNHHSMFLTQLNHSTEVSQLSTEHSLNVSSKRLRIQGRQPIERMRRDT